ncbi:MAG: ferrochelatase [Gammaproteobacteria bacterium]|jgi:ferrochelatase
MTKFKGSPSFSHEQPGSTGILLVNLGTPDEPTTAAVRRYLAEFLSDQRVIEIPKLIWKIILHGIILRVRPKKVAHAYQMVWTENGSPLLAITRSQAAALVKPLSDKFKAPVNIEMGMRYGNPSIASALNKLKATGSRRIIVLPLYPQYSATTSATVFDAVADELKTWRWLPDVRFISHYPDYPLYIEGLVNSIKSHQVENGIPDKLLFSFHGLPKRNLELGDPYYCECQKTARLVVEQLGLTEEQYQVCFQSRFGKAEWLQPYTDKTLEAWGKQGIEHVQVICPGFAADCLETLEEINMQNRAFFLDAGGKQFGYIPALNDNPEHIEMLEQLILQHAGDWVDIKSENTDSRASRAKALGAGK